MSVTARNLRLLPWFVAARGGLVWLPVTYLFVAERLGAEAALQVSAAYYLAGIVLEVPSGWMSDTLGRRPTLVLAGVAQVLGGLLFAFGESFGAFIAAQVLISASWAFVSGTDTSLLFESLEAEGRGGELARQESKLMTASLASLSFASLLGGVLGSIDLRWPFFATAAYGAVALGLALALRDAPTTGAPAPERGMLVRLRGRLFDPVLRWVLAWSVATYVLNHLPFEFLQAWLSVLGAAAERPLPADTPMLSGLTYAGLMLVGALVSARSGALRARLGRGASLAIAFALQLLIVAAMAAFVHPAVLALLLLRSVPMALTRPIVAELVHPRLDDRLRATWFSAMNLVGAGSLGAVLWLGGLWLGEAPVPEASALRSLLLALGGLSAAAGLMLWRAWAKSPPPVATDETA